jgi:hypothetical protein
MKHAPLKNQLFLPVDSVAGTVNAERRARRSHSGGLKAVPSADAGRDERDGVCLADRHRSSPALLGNEERASWFVDDDAWAIPLAPDT